MGVPEYPAEDLLRQVGPYTIERLLGRGGMAAVYAARDPKHDRMVALKVFSAEASSLADAERFVREIQVAARLQHPHLCAIHDSGASDGLLWFTMPLVAGETLRARLVREPRPPVPFVRRVIREAAAGLQAAHRAGIVHRDLKPENLLLTDDDVTLVADFGIARPSVPVGGASAPALTGTGMLLGTPAYMSPEQLEGRADLGPACDQYALALVAYEMLAGRHPYATGTGEIPLFSRVVQAPDPLTTRRPDLPRAIDGVLARALVTDPAARHPSITAFAEAFEAALEAPAAAAAAREAATRPSRRPRVVAGAVLAVGLLAAAWLWRDSTGRGAARTPRLAVLPFENVGSATDSAFAGGVSDIIRERLATLADVEVLARGTTVAAHARDPGASDVGRRLDLDYVLGGTVRWSHGDSQVVIIPELIRTRDREGRILWSDRIAGRVQEVYALQEQVVARVARAMDATLAGTTDEALALGTRNLDAHAAFTAGERESLHGTVADGPRLRRAAEYYANAVTLDPQFGLAWSRLAWARAYAFATGGGRAEVLAMVRDAVDSAKVYAPNVPYTSLAESFYVASTVSRERGLRVAIEAAARFPNSAMLLAQAATLHMRLGQVDSARVLIERARRVDPRDPTVLLRATMIYNALHAYAASDSVSTVAREAGAGNTGLLMHRVSAALGRGDTVTARRRLEEAVGESGVPGFAYLARALGAFPSGWIARPAQMRILLEADSSAFAAPLDRYLTRALVLRYLGDSANARTELQAAVAWNALARERFIARSIARGAPAGTAIPVNLGEAVPLAMLGDCGPIRQVADRVAARSPVDAEYLAFPYELHNIAAAMTACGDAARAIDFLEWLLRLPTAYSRAWLALDPAFAPLRGEPRFKALVAP